MPRSKTVTAARPYPLLLPLFALLVFALLGWATARAQSIDEQIKEHGYAWVAGQTEFSNHCAACHGEDAKGHGPVADMFKTAVPDLTKLTQQKNGSFPYYLVYETIDGRKIPRAHGTIEMPVFGDRYREERTDAEGQRMVHARIFELIIYLQSLQEK